MPSMFYKDIYVTLHPEPRGPNGYPHCFTAYPPLVGVGVVGDGLVRFKEDSMVDLRAEKEEAVRMCRAKLLRPYRKAEILSRWEQRKLSRSIKVTESESKKGRL